MRGGHVPISPEEVARFRVLYARGLSMKQVGEQCGRAPGLVCKYLHRLGVRTRSPGRKLRHHRA